MLEQIAPGCDLRSALYTMRNRSPEDLIMAGAMNPDEAASYFAARHAGPPASSRRGPEPAMMIDVQASCPSILLGTYGCEDRVRSWLPGLPQKIAPGSISTSDLLPPRQVSSHRHVVEIQSLDDLPIPRVTPRDAGRYISMGFILAGNPSTGEVALSAHRMLVLGPDRLGIWMLPSRRLRELRNSSDGGALPVSINIGAPPAAVIASATSTEQLPDGHTKLSLSGLLVGQPIEICETKMLGAPAFARSEITIEGNLSSDEVLEGATPASVSMPEFLGYDGTGMARLAVIHVKGITAEPSAIFQSTIGPGREQSTILGLGGALSLAIGDKPWPAGADIEQFRFSHSGGGMLLLFVVVRKRKDNAVQAIAKRIFDASPFTKTIIFVDPDVDPSSEEDIFWAMTTRARLEQDVLAFHNYPALGMDPSQRKEWLENEGVIPAKTVIDATVPLAASSSAQRSFRV